MAYFQRRNPWDPGYALSNTLLGEPPGRGTLTTKGITRGTIDTVNAHQTQANYAVPGFVLAETPGRGVYDNPGLPRRWVDTKAPDDLTRPFPPAPDARGSLSGTVFSKRTLSGSSLGDVRRYGRQRRPRLPFDGLGALSDKYKIGSFYTVTVLGIPLKLQMGYSIAGLQWKPYSSTNVRTFADVPKSKVPASVANKINEQISKAVQTLLKKDPNLAKTPKKLLSQAKTVVGLMPGVSSAVSETFKRAGLSDAAAVTNYLLLGVVKEIDGIDVEGKYWAIQAQDYGDKYRIIVRRFGDPGTFEKLASLVTWPLRVTVGTLLEATVNIASWGIEHALNGLGYLMDKACAAAQSELVNLTGDVGLASATAQGAIYGAAQKIIASSCGGSGAVPPPYTEQKKSMLPWIIAGGGAILITLAVSR